MRGLRRLRQHALHMVLVVLGASLVTFVMLDIAPGDSASAILGEDATTEQVEQVRESLGLNDPLHERWLRWAGDAVRGDLGDSIVTQQPVFDEIVQRLPITFQLTLMALAISLLLAVPTAIWSAYRPDGKIDRIAQAITSTSLSTPGFLVATAGVYVLAIKLGWVPVTGWTRFTDDPLGNLRGAILPALVLAHLETAIILRVLRSDLIDTLQEDYILSAFARGVPTRRILVRHALRPSSTSVLTLGGLILGRLMGGSVVVEFFFALPGLGNYMITAVSGKDVIVVQGVVVFVALMYVTINAVVDIVQPLLDPRVEAS